MDQEKAEALADTFATQFLPNYRNDPEQESVFQNTLEEIREMDPGDSPAEIVRRGWHSERNTEKSSTQVASQPDDDLQRRAPPHVLSFRVKICKTSPCSETQKGPPLT
ncbi:hypothetical protein Trydic_g1613 [Trypoxylus dichotomus]